MILGRDISFLSLLATDAVEAEISYWHTLLNAGLLYETWISYWCGVISLFIDAAKVKWLNDKSKVCRQHWDHVRASSMVSLFFAIPLGHAEFGFRLPFVLTVQYCSLYFRPSLI